MSQRSDDDIVILGGARTPVGAFMGSLSRLTATELGVAAAEAALERSGVEAGAIDAAFVGNVLQADSDAAYLARHVALGVGAPVEATALTLNRLCGSGLETIIQGARVLAAGEASFVLAGGAETMSRVPHSLRGVRRGWGLGQGEVEDTLFAALHDAHAGCAIGQTVEHLAQSMEITREQADAFALSAHQRAARAQAEGRLAEEIAPVPIKSRRGTRTVEHDESIRPETTAEGLAALRPIYGPGGVSTAGNSTGLNDAAAMVVMTTRERARAHGLEPLGAVAGWASAGVPPKMMGLGPVPATQKALERAGWSLEDLQLVEINDSFAAQFVAVERKLGIDREITNVNGGAVSLGHPMGATGTRLALALLMTLARRDLERGMATLCIGGGQGTSLLLRRG